MQKNKIALIMMIKTRKVRDHCHCTRNYRGATHNTWDLWYKTPKEISAVFHNDSTCDYLFIIKEVAKECKGEFKYLGENREKCITFSVSVKNDKNK